MTMSAMTLPERGAPTAPGTYQEFLSAVRREGWTVGEITDDVGEEMPPGLRALRDAVGPGRYEGWVIRALDAGDLPDPNRREPANGWLPPPEDAVVLSVRASPEPPRWKDESGRPWKPLPGTRTFLRCLPPGTHFEVNQFCGVILFNNRCESRVRVFKTEDGPAKMKTIGWSNETVVRVADPEKFSCVAPPADNKGMGQETEGGTGMTATTSKGRRLRVGEPRLRRLMYEVGHLAVETWDVKKLQALANRLDEDPDAEGPEGEEDRKLYHRIVETLRGGGEVVVEPGTRDTHGADGDDDGEGDTGPVEKPTKARVEKPKAEKPTKARVEKPTKPKAEKPKAEKPTAEKAARDRFGNREGTRAAAINAVLTKKPKSLGDITEESGAKSVSEHLRYLAKKGLVAKSADGWYVK